MDIKKTNDEQNKGWFNRTFVQLSAISLSTFGLFKIKGQLGTTVQKYIKDYQGKITKRNAWKNIDSQERMLGDTANLRQKFGISSADKRFDELFKESLFIKADPFVVEQIEMSENSLIGSIENDLKKSVMDKTAVPQDMFVDKDELLYKIREDTLYQHINTNSELRTQDRMELDTIRKINDKNKLYAIHKYYLENDKNYTLAYKKRLSSLKFNYRSSMDQMRSSNKKIFNIDDIKNSLYGKELDTSIETAVKLRYLGLPENKIHGLKSNINVFDLLGSKKEITSGSLSTRVNLPIDKRFALLSQFNYTGQLKKIASILDEVVLGDRKQSSGVRNVTMNIINEPSLGADERFFLEINLYHQSKGMSTIRVPMAQHGRIPGSSPGVREILDGFYLKPNEFLSGSSDLFVNQQLENKTQQMLNSLIDILDSEMIEKDFNIDPGHFSRRVTSSLNRVLDDTMPAVSTNRDYINMMRLVVPTLTSKKSKFQLLRLKDAVTSGKNLRILNNLIKEKADFVNITLDFETLSRDLSGPEWMARDEFTELTKAGIVITDYKNGSATSLPEVKEIVSDHSIESFNKWRHKKTTIEWLRQEVEASVDMSDSDVVTTWKKQLTSQAKSSELRNGKRFSNNRDFAEYIGEILLTKLRKAKANRKNVFITTKNGTTFDLKLLQIYAPKQWNELKEYANFIDVQSIAYFDKIKNGEKGSLSLKNLLVQLMRKHHASQSEISFVSKGNMQKAVEFFRSKGILNINESHMQDYFNQGVIGRAHTPAADALATNVLLIGKYNDVMSNEVSYNALSKLEKMLIRGDRMLGLDESFEEARQNERMYKIHGHVVSQSLMSHGQIAKNIMSLVPVNHMLPFSDNKMSKQWDQFFNGVNVRHSNTWKNNINNRLNLSEKQLYNKYFRNPFISQGEINASFALKADGMINYFQNHIRGDTIYTLNTWAGQEGYIAVSENALKRYNIHIPDRVDLSQVSSQASDPIFNKRLIDLKHKIYTSAKKLADADHGIITSKHWDEAAKLAMNDMEKSGTHIFKAGELELAGGDQGIETTKKELGGKLVNVLVSNEANTIKMHAEIEYLAGGGEMADKSTFNLRLTGSKAVAVKDRWNSVLMATGADFLANADFMEKGYVGVQKQLIIQKILDKLFDDYDSSTGERKANAEKLIRKISQDLNASVSFEHRELVHNPDAPGQFKYLSSQSEIDNAMKYYGNIDMSLEKLNNYMVDAGLVWTEEKYRQWMQLGPKRIQSWIDRSVHNHSEKTTKMLANSSELYHHLKEADVSSTGKDYAVHLQKWVLPPMELVREGKAAMLLEPIRSSRDDPMAFIPGFRVFDRGAVYGLLKGRNPKMTDLKLRGSLFDLIDQPFSHVSPSTIEDIRSAKKAYNGDRFTAARATREKFINALYSKSITKIPDLNINEIRKLLDNKGTLDIKSLSRHVFNDTEQGEILNNLTKELEIQADRSENFEKAINNIINEMQENRLAEAFEQRDPITGRPKSSFLMAVSAASQWEEMAAKKGVFAFSRNPKLGGPFEFKVRDILKNLLTDDELPDNAEKKIMLFFNDIYKKTGTEGVVESIDMDTGTIKLKKLIMHADTSKANILNVLNPMAKEKTFGYVALPTKHQYRMLDAYMNYNDAINTLAPDDVHIQKQENFLKKQYMNYIMKGFLMDSSSVYSQAELFAPRGWQSPARSYASIIQKAIDINKAGGLTKFDFGFKSDQVQQYDKIINRLAGLDPSNPVNITDVFVTESVFDKMEDSRGNRIASHLEKLVGDKTKAREIAYGMTNDKVYGYMTRFPNMQAGYDAKLQIRFNVIPDKLGKYLGMNSNEVAAHPIYGKLFGMDFDGDIVYAVIKSLKTAEQLGDYHKDHVKSLQTVLESNIKDTTLGKIITKGYIRDFSNGKMNISKADSQGNLVHQSIDLDDTQATEIMTKYFEIMADNTHTSELSSPRYATKESVQYHLDQIANIVVSKEHIGIFTNIAYRRTRQLMQVGLVGKDSVAAKMLMGNLSTGDAGLAQMFISMGKHGSPEEMAIASKAYINPFTNDEQAHAALKKLYTEKLIPKEQQDRASQYYDEYVNNIKKYKLYTPKDDMSGASIKALEDIDMLKDKTNVMDLTLSRAQTDFLNDRYDVPQYRSPFLDIGDELSKRFKLDFNIRASFKKSGKFAGIGAAIYIATNFFRPSQLSNSNNPFDAFTDLGTDIDGNHNAFFADMELDPSIPINSVNASFSKQAYLRMNKIRDKKSRSDVIMGELIDSYRPNTIVRNFNSKSKDSYSNYTNYVPAIGTSQMEKRYSY